MVLWELTGKLVFIMDSRFHGNDTNTIIVIPAKAGIHPMQDSFPRYLPKSQKNWVTLQNFPATLAYHTLYGMISAF
jgi:hypothetical protein